MQIVCWNVELLLRVRSSSCVLVRETFGLCYAVGSFSAFFSKTLVTPQYDSTIFTRCNENVDVAFHDVQNGQPPRGKLHSVDRLSMLLYLTAAIQQIWGILLIEFYGISSLCQSIETI